MKKYFFMKKSLLIIVMLQFLSLNIWADSYEIVFRGETAGDIHPEFEVPVTGTINSDNKELNVKYGGSDYATVSVKNSFGSVVYQKQVSSASRQTVNVDMKNYQSGSYTVSVEDSQGNVAVGNFQLTK